MILYDRVKLWFVIVILSLPCYSYIAIPVATMIFGFLFSRQISLLIFPAYQNHALIRMPLDYRTCAAISVRDADAVITTVATINFRFCLSLRSSCSSHLHHMVIFPCFIPGCVISGQKDEIISSL